MLHWCAMALAESTPPLGGTKCGHGLTARARESAWEGFLIELHGH